MKILLTAEPGAGKSTVLSKFMTIYKGDLYGIVTKEIRDESNNRVGFKAVNMQGDEKIFMHKTDIDSNITIANKYKVDLSTIENFMVPEILKGMNKDGVILIDEIGRAEAVSELFLDTVRQLVNINTNILGVIVYDPEQWSMEFKNNPDIKIILVTPDNRDALPNYLVELFTNKKD